MKRRHTHKETTTPRKQFTAEAGRLFPFPPDRGRNVFLSAGLSTPTGYERVNQNGRLPYDGMTLRNDGAFTYGLVPSFEVEAYLTDRWAFPFNVRQRVFFGSSIGRFHTIIAARLKYIID